MEIKDKTGMPKAFPRVQGIRGEQLLMQNTGNIVGNNREHSKQIRSYWKTALALLNVNKL